MIVNGWRLPDGEQHFVKHAERNKYQANLLNAALPFVVQLRTAVDIGAHVGFHTRKMLGVFDDVWAFEPVPENYECLRHNAPDARCVRVALGNQRGDVHLSCPTPGNSGAWERDDGGRHVAPLMLLDDYPIGEVDFVKIDVQGMEADVLKGGENTIRRWKPIIAIEVVMRGEVNPAVAPILDAWGTKHLATVGKDIIVGWP